MNVVKLLLGKAPHEMDDDELDEHVRNVRKLRGEAFVSGRRVKKAKAMTSSSKETKEMSELAKTLGVSSDDLIDILLELVE